MFDFHPLADPVYAPVQQAAPAPAAPAPEPDKQRMIGDYVSALQPTSMFSDGTPGYNIRPTIGGPGADTFNNLWSTMYGNTPGAIGAPPYSSGGGSSFSMTNPSQQNGSLGQNF